MRETGQVLKSLQVTKCRGGPHEVRGCFRKHLIHTLAEALPNGTIRFGCNVDNVSLSNEGEDFCLFLTHDEFYPVIIVPANQVSITDGSCHHRMRDNPK